METRCPAEKNADAMERALRIAKTGLPLRFAAEAAAITTETLRQWRLDDPEFCAAFDQVRLAAVEARWETIRKASEKGLPRPRQAASWMLERSNPSEFGRPEIQLNTQFNSQTNVSATIVITAEVAENLQRRNAVLDKELDALAKTHEARAKRLNGSNGIDSIREVEAESSLVHPGPITLPGVKLRTASWWKTLSCGDSGAEITSEAARFIIETVATDTLGATRAAGVKFASEDDPVALRDVWAAIQDFGGWETLVKRGAVKKGTVKKGAS